jgi:hypothetical protein
LSNQLKVTVSKRPDSSSSYNVRRFGHQPDVNQCPSPLPPSLSKSPSVSLPLFESPTTPSQALSNSFLISIFNRACSSPARKSEPKINKKTQRGEFFFLLQREQILTTLKIALASAQPTHHQKLGLLAIPVFLLYSESYS